MLCGRKMPPKQTRPKNCAWTAQGKGGRPIYFIPLPHSRIQPPSVRGARPALTLNWARHNWIHRFVKWGQIHQLVSGSFDYVERPELLELLRIRTASYSGFFVKHFPKDKPTPKQYFALTHAVEFLAENDFSGEGDEQPMETLHHDRLWVKSRHCVQRKMALEHCLNSMHVRNNVKIFVLADKAQS